MDVILWNKVIEVNLRTEFAVFQWSTPPPHEVIVSWNYYDTNGFVVCRERGISS